MNDFFPGLSDPSFLFFLQFAAILLGVVGLTLFIMQRHPSTKKAAQKIAVAYKPWLVMAPICFIAVGIGGQFLIAALLLLSICGAREFIRATGLSKDRYFTAAIYLSIAIIYLAVSMGGYQFFLTTPIYILALLMILPALRNEYENMLQRVGLSVIAILYLGWFPAHLAFLSYYPASFAYLLFLFIGTELNDASAYICGRLFGKRLLLPKISPKKTVEGFLGACILVCIYVWAVHSWIPGFDLTLLILSALLFTIGGTLGDLVISFIKRDIGIKDMGKLIPGHGGLLDRVDSLILIAPLYFQLIKHFLPVPGALQ